MKPRELSIKVKRKEVAEAMDSHANINTIRKIAAAVTRKLAQEKGHAENQNMIANGRIVRITVMEINSKDMKATQLNRPR